MALNKPAIIFYISLVSTVGIKETYSGKVFTLTSKFVTVVQKSAFVDKSLFIKTVFESPNKILITAPRKFGKSVNLNMLKRFLEIEVDRKGNLITEMAETDLINDTRNYMLFQNLEISKYPAIMRQHFGKHPVIRVDGKCFYRVRYHEEAVDFTSGIVKGGYLDHRYLMNSKRLTKSEIQLFRSWYYYFFDSFSERKVLDGLRMLSELLYKHFEGKKIFVLIDEYESVFSEPMLHNSEDEELKNTIEFCVGVITSLLVNNPYVERVIMSGRTYVAGEKMSVIGNNVMMYRFLGDHPFVDYYGLTRNEVARLFSKPEFNVTEIDANQVHEYYGGYMSKTGKLMYNTYSVLNYLKTRAFKNYWTGTRYFTSLKNTLGMIAVNKSIEVLLQNNTVDINICEKITVEDFVFLRKFGKKSTNTSELVTPDIFLSLLLEIGYLTYTPKNCGPLGRTAVKIPNKEIKEKLVEACSRLKH